MAPIKLNKLFNFKELIIISMETIIVIVIAILVWYFFYANRNISKKVENTVQQKEKTPSKSSFDLSKYNSIQRDAICPNCLTKLDSFPQRKRKCKSCKKDIIRVKVPDTKEVLLLNETEGLELKAFIDKYYDDKSLISELSSSEYESSEEEVLKFRDAFFKKYNTNSDDEFFKSYTNKKLQEQAKKKNFHNAKMISLHMLNKYKDKLEGQYELDEEAVLDYKPAYSDAVNMVNFTIMETKKLVNNNFSLSFYTKEINGCSKKDLDNKEFSPEELLNNAAIPCKNCTADIYNLYDCVKSIIASPK